MKKLRSHDKKVSRADTKLRQGLEDLARKRRKRPRELIDDVELKTGTGTMKLSQLFGPKRDLILIHNMGKNCPYCTLWADGFNGVYPHLADRAAFFVISYDAPDTQKKFAAGRNWVFPMISAEGSDLVERLGFGTRKEPLPGVSTFVKERGKVYRVAHARFGPWDPFCSVWHLFGMLDKGVAGWEPKFSYIPEKLRRALRRTSVPRDPLKEPIEEMQPDIALSQVRSGQQISRVRS